MRTVLLLLDALVRLLARRNLRSDRFGTVAAILGVALGAATVSVVLVLDVNTMRVEAGQWASNPELPNPPDTIGLRGLRHDGSVIAAQSARQATHEDYEVMRSAIRLGSLSAFLVGALIVFFTFGVVIDRRRREVALLRSLGALPRQVAAIFVREAVIIGVAGAALGFLLTVPMSYAAAAAGITTTGRARIAVAALRFPWAGMGLVSAIGAGMALLGVLRPVRDVLRLDVPGALRPRFLAEEGARGAARRTKGITLIALPFMVLVYVLMRPFFRRALPSLTFFVVEAGFVCLAFLTTLVLVPELVQRLGGLVVRALPGGRTAERLLTQRRIEHLGHELAWSVSGVMMVFALLLALHIATYGLKHEVVVWARDALQDELFVIPVDGHARADHVAEMLPPGELWVPLSGRTPWPNAVEAAAPEALASLAEANGRPDLAALARRLGPGKIILSKMMSRRFRVKEGDQLELFGRAGTRALSVVAVTDGLGFTPVPAPYRNAKTYGLIDVADADLIAPYAAPVGAQVIVARGSSPAVRPWLQAVRRARLEPGLRYLPARPYRSSRIQETDKDFVIFDLMLLMTSVLAAVGIANQLILSVRARTREIALYRVLGMTVRQVRRLVLMEGAFVGLLGGGLAAVLGVPLGYAAVGSLKAVSAFEVDFHLPPLYVPLTIAGSLVIALFASLYPAARAAGADSAESVHYE
jgi:putative ABC transport system permease protein